MSKKCFIITPIGAEGTQIREQADEITRLSKEVLKEYGYEEKNVIVQHQSTDIGMINHSIFSNIQHADLIIANLSGHNPNVYYELAIADAFDKRVICFSNDPSNIPFDQKDRKAYKINFDFSGPNKFEKQLRSIMENIDKISQIKNPLKQFISSAKIEDMISKKTDSIDPEEAIKQIAISMNELNRRISENERLKYLSKDTYRYPKPKRLIIQFNKQVSKKMFSDIFNEFNGLFEISIDQLRKEITFQEDYDVSVDFEPMIDRILLIAKQYNNDIRDIMSGYRESSELL